MKSSKAAFESMMPEIFNPNQLVKLSSRSLVCKGSRNETNVSFKNHVASLDKIVPFPTALI